MTSKFSRPAVIAALAIGASGLVAVPADAAFQAGTGLVNQPVATGVSGITPESAVVSGAIDTGGFLQPNDSTSSTTAGGYAVAVTPGSTWDSGVTGTGFPIPSTTSSITIDGIPLTTPDASGNPVPTYSGVWVEYDPLSDWEASGNAPGPETQIAPEEDVNTSSAPYTAIPSIEIGGYPAATAQANGAEPLQPNTTYVYWLEQQTDETTAATTINEFNPIDLYNFLDQTSPSGSGAEVGTAGGTSGGTSAASLFGEAGDGGGTGGDAFNASPGTSLSWNSSYTNADDETAWQAGNGIYGANSLGAASTGLFAGKVSYTDALDKTETLNLTSLANPDYQCAPDYDLVKGGPFGVDTVGQPWASYTSTGTVSGGISGYSNGSLTYAGAEPEEQGSCVDFLGSSANQNFFITSATGEFTTLPLGKITFGKTATVSGKYATVKVYNKSGEDARGTIDLTVKVKRKVVTVAAGTYRVAAHGTSVMTLKLTAKGKAEVAAGPFKPRLVLTSATDQKTTTKSIKL